MLRWLIGRPDHDEVRLPVLKNNYESTVPGLYIVGDLAGAPTIRAAANQGVEVMGHIGSLEDARAEKHSDVYDVVIIGGGSSGIAAAMEAKCCQNLRTIVLESGRLANTIREFPKGKEIYAEPKGVAYRARLWLEDSIKEELLEKWDAQLEKEDLEVRESTEVTAVRRVQGCFEVEAKDGDVIKGRRVVLAIGKRGNPRRLGIPGEDLDKVAYRLYDPEDHRSENVLVVGGGDSAVEAALALAETAKKVTLSYRRDGFFRLKSRNREKIDAAIDGGRVEAVFSSEVADIAVDRVTLKIGDDTVDIDNDWTLVAAGAELPHKFFKKTGIRMEKEWTPLRWVGLLAATAFFWLLYAAKKYPPLWPFSAFGIGWNDLNFGVLHWWEWFAILYSLAVLVFGIKAMRKYWYSKFQRWKYASVIFFQCFMLCILPIFLLPALGSDYGYAFHLVLAWPLSIDAIWKPAGAGDWGAMAYALLLTFVLIPALVYFHGSRFCSWICGCGALAETLGDNVRNLAPRGPKSIRFERIAGKVVLVFAILLTVYALFAIFFGNWAAAREGPLFALYAIAVDTMLAGAVGIAFYWFMGNRVWCRFFCPLRMYMNVIGRFMSRFKIVPARDKCIACGQCSRECQMGIPVMDFAKQANPVTLENSSCIGCGICVDVCPVDVLHWNEEQARAAEPASMKE